MSFFSMSFSEWKTDLANRDEVVVGDLYDAWRNEGARRYAKIKASPHYHTGMPCIDFGCYPDGTRDFKKVPQTFED